MNFFDRKIRKNTKNTKNTKKILYFKVYQYTNY